MKYMHRLSRRVVKTIDKILSDKFGATFDDCTTSSVKYVGVFATFPIQKQSRL